MPKNILVTGQDLATPAVELLTSAGFTPVYVPPYSGGEGLTQAVRDADLVVLNTTDRKRITPKSDYGEIGYNPYTGLELTGFPATTIYRGKPVVRNGTFLGEEGQGRFIERVPTKG